MSVRGIFVGVSKHVDPTISELNGALDAKALWALFSDSVNGLEARLLVDQTATTRDVSTAVFGILGDADQDDVVVISFAGHGTPDGNLVLHDTQRADLLNTTISMVQLAEAFKATRARAVLFILDCCFSGHAPARVLDVGATPRSAFALSGVAGEGRILLSACSPTESAWEQPGSGHGILTHAVLEALTQSGESISFPDVLGEIIRSARVEAERIGVTQTPEFLGSVKGGLVFPAFKRGDNFYAAFPAAPTRQISGKFEELRDFGIPPEIVEQWVARFPQGLNPLQLRAANDHGVLAGKPLLVVAPTSSGKTLIGELAALRAVGVGKKAAFLLPYRALVNEKYQEFSERYGAAGLRVVRCCGDASDGVGPTLAGRYDIGIFTYETFLNLALISPRLLHQLGLVVVDEGQFITDPNRGITVELIFSLLLRGRQRGIDPQLVVLSAVLGNLNAFDKWLGLPLLLSLQRPVPLIEGVLDRRGTFQFLDSDGTTKTETLLAPGRIVQRRDKASSQDVIVPLAQQLVSNGERLLIFRNVRGTAQGCAKYLAKELGLPPATAALKALPTQDVTLASGDLRECLSGGTAFHNTNLLKGEREAVEKGFRDPNGGIHVLVSTTTLAAGINTPASTVVLAENEFKGEDGRPFTVAEYKNMAGRAGRLGFKETGKSIILAETQMERAQLFQKYVLGSPEAVKSSFQSQDLPTWLLRLLSQVHGVRTSEIPSLLVNTFAGYTASRANPQWVRDVEQLIAALLSRMLANGLAEQDGDLIHLTLLGRACGASSLSFESSLRLVEMMKSIDAAKTLPIHVLGVVQILEEMDGIYTPIMKRGGSESKRAGDVSRRYGNVVMNALQSYSRELLDYWRRCKRAALLFDWVGGTPIEVLEKEYTANPFQGVVSYGDITRIAEGTRFHLRSAHQILSVLFPGQSDFLSGLEQIIVRLEVGLPVKALPLLNLPVPLVRGQYLALFNAGVLTPETALAMGTQALAALIGPIAADQLLPPAADLRTELTA